MSRPGALPALPRRSPRRCPSALPALPRHLSSAAPVRNFISDPQILSVICDVAPRRSPGASPALSPALPQRSPGAPTTPLKCRTCAQLYSRPSNSLGNLRCRAAHLSSAEPSRRPWQANFSERAKKKCTPLRRNAISFLAFKTDCLNKP